MHAFLRAFLLNLSESGGKLVIASGSTSHLDEVQGFLESDLGLESGSHSSSTEILRLDGSTQVKKRQHVVERFRAEPAARVFLLSTR